MKKNILYISLFFAISNSLFSQFKVGSNPKTITSNTFLEVESTSGSKIVIRKDTAMMGINNSNPNNKLEITHGTSGNSGLRFTNLTNANNAKSANSVNQKYLSVNSVGDVVLANSVDQLISVTGLASSLASPVAAATFQAGVFQNNYSKIDSEVVYVNQTDGTQWIYSASNGGQYKSYSAPASTEWYNAGSTIDAGSNKTSSIWRIGNVGLGTNLPYCQFANTNVNTLGSDAIGTSTGGLSWANSFIGYTASFFNSGTTSSFNGLSIKIAGNQATNTALNVSQGTTQGTVGSPLLVVLGNGNVGIGTNNPSTNLHINNRTLATNTINAAATVLRMSRPQNPAVKWDNIAQFNLGSYSSSTANSTSRLDLAMSNEADNTTLSNVMTWQANGNVGIIKTNPLLQLQLGNSGNLSANKVYDGNSFEGFGFQHYINTSGENVNSFTRVGDIVVGSPTSGSAGAGVLRFLTSSNAEAGGNIVEKMRIHSNGFLGIGTTSPNHPLHVKSSASTSLYVETTSGNPNGVVTINMPSANTVCGAGQLNCSKFLMFQVGGTNIGNVTPNGAGTATLYNTTSDFRLKENIASTHFSIADLMKMNVVDYNYKMDKNKNKEIGFVAQELHKLIPSVVNVGTEELDEKGMPKSPWMVDYGKLTPIVIKAAQDLKKENDAQQILINSQAQKIEELMKRLEVLEAKMK